MAALRTLLLDWPDEISSLLMAAKVGIQAGPAHLREALQHARYDDVIYQRVSFE